MVVEEAISINRYIIKSPIKILYLTSSKPNNIHFEICSGEDYKIVSRYGSKGVG